MENLQIIVGLVHILVVLKKLGVILILICHKSGYSF